jgi:hypothetical protein
MNRKLISYRQQVYPAVHSLNDLFIFKEILAYDSRQKCVVTMNPLAKTIPSQIFPLAVDRIGRMLDVHFNPYKSPNPEMKSEIKSVLFALVKQSKAENISSVGIF